MLLVRGGVGLGERHIQNFAHSIICMCMYVCVFSMCMYVCMYVCIYVLLGGPRRTPYSELCSFNNLYLYVCMYVFLVCVCMYACVGNWLIQETLYVCMY
jgi:hypothetical protein